MFEPTGVSLQLVKVLFLPRCRKIRNETPPGEKKLKKRNFLKSEIEAADTFLGKSFFKPVEDSVFFSFPFSTFPLFVAIFTPLSWKLRGEEKKFNAKKCFQHF